MNSRAATRRSHRSRIRPREAVSNRYSMVEPADQAAQRRVGHGFVPVVESGIERLFMLERREHRAQDGRHPQQRGKTSAKADAAKGRENHENDYSQTEASDNLGRFELGRFQFSRQIRNQRQVWNPFAMKLSQQTGSSSGFT